MSPLVDAGGNVIPCDRCTACGRHKPATAIACCSPMYARPEAPDAPNGGCPCIYPGATHTAACCMRQAHFRDNFGCAVTFGEVDGGAEFFRFSSRGRRRNALLRLVP